MKLIYQSTLDIGSQENERILFNVSSSCNLGNFLIALSRKIDAHSVSSKIEHPFWLNDADLKEKDLVVIYTTRKEAGIKSLQNQSGSTSYFVFWNLDKTLKELDEYSFVLFDTEWKVISNPSTETNEGNPT